MGKREERDKQLERELMYWRMRSKINEVRSIAESIANTLSFTLECLTYHERKLTEEGIYHAKKKVGQIVNAWKDAERLYNEWKKMEGEKGNE